MFLSAVTVPIPFYAGAPASIEFGIEDNLLHRLFFVDDVHEIVRRHLIEQYVDIRHAEIAVDQDNALTGLSVGYGHVYGYIRFTDAAFTAINIRS